jgi:hypothetical protein
MSRRRRCILRKLATFPVNSPIGFVRIFQRDSRCYLKSAIRFFERTQNMAQVYFQYSNTEGVLMDRGAAAVGNLAEACEQATLVVRSLIMAPSEEDWRSWVLHVSDEHGDEIFDVPFTSILGKPH